MVLNFSSLPKTKNRYVCLNFSCDCSNEGQSATVTPLPAGLSVVYVRGMSESRDIL